MYLLDTVHLTILERGGEGCRKLRARLAQVDSSKVRTSIISYEEQMRGWLSQAAKASRVEAQVRIYQKLEQNLLLFARIPMLSFDSAAAVEFE
jgi:tRNA(fMet)-specific endonuclease VapC